MNQPSVTNLGEDLLFGFPGPDADGQPRSPIISVEVSRYKESSNGHYAELTIDAPTGRLLWTTLRLDSDRERVVLANKLNKRWEDFDWDDALRQICQLTVTAHREGSPLLDLALMEPPEAQHLIRPLLPMDQTTILYGPGDAGKSLLALWVAAGYAYSLPLPGLEKHEAAPALYLDWETDWTAHAYRLRGLMRGFGLTPGPNQILYRQMTSSVAGDLRALKKHIAANGIGLVVVDSLAAATGPDFMEAGMVVRCMQALRDLGVTVLAIHHLAKGQLRSNRSADPYGSVYYFNLARCTWETRRSDDGFGGVMALFQRKYNDGPKQKEPLGFAVRYEEEGITVAQVNVAEEKSLEQYLRVADRIAAYMAEEGDCQIKELADALSVRASTISQTLRREVRFVKIESAQGRKGGSRWGLKDRDNIATPGQATLATD